MFFKTAKKRHLKGKMIYLTINMSKICKKINIFVINYKDIYLNLYKILYICYGINLSLYYEHKRNAFNELNRQIRARFL